MKKQFAMLLMFVTVVASAQQSFDTVKIRPQKIAEHIYLLKGSGGNIGVLTGADGVVMIDDQFAPLSEKIAAAIKTLDSGPIRFLINTHVHGDHSGGNDNFSKAGATIVAHDQVRERMMKESVNLRMNRTFPPREKVAWPVITFDNKLNFHLNDEDIELLHFDPGHTDGDAIIHFKKANVYHTGDAFVRTGYPFIDGSSGGTLNGYISTLAKLLTVLDGNSKVIPGHGDLGTRADVKAVHDMLVDIRDQVAAALKTGKNVEDIPGMNITAKYDAQWGAGFVKGKDFVLVVAENLQSRKTTP
jgi:cyclase